MKYRVYLLGVLILLSCNKTRARDAYYGQGVHYFSQASLIVTKENTHVFKEPNKNSEELITLKITTVVNKIHNEKNLKSSDDTHKDWIYVNTKLYSSKLNDRVKGWVIKDNVVSINEFKKVNSFQDCHIKGERGDTFVNIQLFKNGTFSFMRESIYLPKKAPIKGDIYNFNNIYLLKSNHMGTKGLLFVKKGVPFIGTNKLCHRFYYDAKLKDSTTLACCAVK